jgi:outer membrane protein
MRNTTIYQCLLAAAVLVWPSPGQDAAPLQLTLRDAVNLALKQSPQVILANIGVQFSEEQTRVARSGLLPQVGGNINEAVHRVNLEAAIGLKFPGAPKHVGPFWSFQAGAGFNAPLFDLTLWRRYRSSQIGAETSRAQETAAREDAILLVVSQYLGAQRAAAEAQAAESRAKLAQALYDLAADLQNSGVGTGIDTLRANLQLQNEKQRVLVARTAFETALFGLARLLNVDPLRAISLSDQPAFFETPPVSVDQTLARAYDSRPELKALRLEEQRTQLEVKTAAESRYPKLAVAGGWSQQGITPASVIPAYQVQWNLDLPLFTGGRIDAQRAQAELAVRRIGQQQQEVRNRIALEVKTAAVQLESARGQVTVANLGVELARQEVEQARDRFQAGVTNNIEVVTAQDGLARAADNQIAALYRFNQSRADLAHAVGQMEALYAR